jgi:hypothetical protein
MVLALEPMLFDELTDAFLRLASAPAKRMKPGFLPGLPGFLFETGTGAKT